MMDAARHRLRHHRRADHSLHAGVSRPHDDPLRRGLREDRPAARLRGVAADGDRRPSGRRRRRSRADGGDRARASAPATCASRATTPKAAQLASARRSAFSALARVRPTTILEDATVPRSELAKMIRFIAETAASHQAADRHVRPHGRRQSAPDLPHRRTQQRRDAPRRIAHSRRSSTTPLELGGTITGEHGIGLAKKPWLRQQMGDASFELLRQLKSALDPHGLLNPGKIFD